METLRNEALQFSHVFDPWSTRLLSELSAHTLRHQQDVHEATEEIMMLESEKVKVEECVVQLEQQVKQERKKCDELTTEIYSLEQKVTTLPNHITILQKKEEMLQEKVETQMQHIINHQNEWAKQIQKCQQELQRYQLAIGLSFLTEGNHLKILFEIATPHNSHLNASTTTKCWVSIHIDSNEHYVFNSSYPELPTYQILSLFTELNKTNEFGKFVINMRRILKQQIR